MTERLQPPSSKIKLFYPSSKEKLSQFVGETYSDVGFRDQQFAKRTRRGGPSLREFLHNLGHSGRRLDNFHELELTTPHLIYLGSQFGKKREQVIMSAADLFGQVAAATERFLETHPDDFSAEVTALRALATEVGERKVSMIISTKTDPSDKQVHYIEEPITFVDSEQRA